MPFSSNAVRVYSNSSLKLYQEVDLNLLESEYSEIKDLFKLFSDKEPVYKVMYLEIKEKKYAKVYNKQIKEAKRLLKNTEKRIEYNLGRCEYIYLN